MNEEYLIVWQAAISGLGLIIGSTLYSLGGRSGKYLRRFLASFVLAATVNGVCVWREIWQPLMLIVFPILILGFSLGYGADKLGVKILKRSIVVAAIMCSGILMAYILGGNAWWVLLPHAGLAIWSVFMGVRNPILAAGEEFFVCMLLTTGLMMYPFVNG